MSFCIKASYQKIAFCDSSVEKGDDIKKVMKLGNSVPVASVREMASSLKSKAEANKCDFIIICGHGAPGFQGLGSGTSPVYKKGKDIFYDKITDLAEEFAIINSALKQVVSPILFLAGCHVGDGREGKQLICSVSSMIPNCLVAASLDKMGFYREDKSGRLLGMDIKKLEKGNVCSDPIDFAFALNGKRIKGRKLKKYCSASETDIADFLSQFTYIANINLSFGFLS